MKDYCKKILTEEDNSRNVLKICFFFDEPIYIYVYVYIYIYIYQILFTDTYKNIKI